MKTINVEAKVSNLGKVLSFIDQELEDAGCGMKTSLQISIAVEELFVNVAHYAYAPEEGTIEIGIEITRDPDYAEITLSDTGIPYDPLAKDDPDVSLPAEKRGIGGLGIFMVKKSMDTMTYDYVDGHNVVKIGKYF